MPSSSRLRVYIACSLDGFIAGPNDDLAWLHETTEVPDSPPPPSDALEFEAFMEEVGALLMGRRTYDVISELLADTPWPYGDTPVLVLTHRPLDPSRETVRAITGDISEAVATAKEIAGDKDVYLDGGNLIGQALNSELVDELIITFIPTLLTAGTRLFDGLVSRQSLEFVSHHRFGHDKLQLRARVRRAGSD